MNFQALSFLLHKWHTIAGHTLVDFSTNIHTKILNSIFDDMKNVVFKYFKKVYF